MDPRNSPYLTTHDAHLYAGTRFALQNAATYDSDGNGWVAGGRNLADELQATYVAEVDALLSDLAAVGQLIPDSLAVDVAQRLRDVAAALTSSSHGQHWSADYRDGGRPITGDHDMRPDPQADSVPAPPVLEDTEVAAEPTRDATVAYAGPDDDTQA